MRIILAVSLLQTVLCSTQRESSGKVPDSDVILSFTREFGYRALSGTYDKYCALRFDPSNTLKAKGEKFTASPTVQENLVVGVQSNNGKAQVTHHSDDGRIDIFKRPDVLSRFAADWGESNHKVFCIAQPDIPTFSENIKEARLTKSELKDQPTLHCTVKDPEDNEERTIRYVLPRIYKADVLIMMRIKEKKVLDGRTPIELTGSPVSEGFKFTDEYNAPSAAKTEENKGTISLGTKSLELPSKEKNRYFANAWCTAVLAQVKNVEAKIKEFVDTYQKKENNSVSKVPNGLVMEYSHGAKFSKKDGQCSITMYTIDKDKDAVLGLYQDLIHMNPQGLCFGGTSLDLVPDLGDPGNWSADLEMDPYTQNPNLKCYHNSDNTKKSRQLIAEYRLPFAYSASLPLQQSPKSYKVHKAQPDSSDKEGQGEETADDKTHRKLSRPGIFGQINSSRGGNSPLKGEAPVNAIVFLDKYHDASGGIDKTAVRGIGVMAAKYCAHLDHMKKTFLVTRDDNFMLEFSDQLKKVREKTYVKTDVAESAGKSEVHDVHALTEQAAPGTEIQGRPGFVKPENEIGGPALRAGTGRDIPGMGAPAGSILSSVFRWGSK